MDSGKQRILPDLSSVTTSTNKTPDTFSLKSIFYVMSLTNQHLCTRKWNMYNIKDDLYLSLRFFLRLGRILGIVPFDGIFSRELSQVKFSAKGVAAFQNIFAAILLLSNVVVGAIRLIRTGGQNPSEWAWAAENFLFFSISLFIFVYFYTHGSQLLKLFEKWRETTTFFCIEDIMQFKDINIVAALICTSTVFENLMFHVKAAPQIYSSDDTFTAFLKKYYQQSRTYWPKLIPYNGYIVATVFISNKLATYSTNFIDVLIIVISRALYGKFRALIHEGRKSLLHTPKGTVILEKEKWKLLIADHTTICQLVDEFEKFLNPLVFISYALNIYYICLQVHLGLTSTNDKTLLDSLYAFYSFVHFIGRVTLVSLSAARIHSYGHKITSILYQCPVEANSIELEKKERFLSMHKLGLSGLGCFIITKPFLLKIVGVVFTFEIVLLQSGVPETVANAEKE